tara:strand:+ start:575 stop:919 length:345 start_codon:yes stop_codon:yes gene_type:complete
MKMFLIKNIEKIKTNVSWIISDLVIVRDNFSKNSVKKGICRALSKSELSKGINRPIEAISKNPRIIIIINIIKILFGSLFANFLKIKYIIIFSQSILTFLIFYLMNFYLKNKIH